MAVQYEDILVDKIADEVEGRLPLVSSVVDDLVCSIKEIGLIEPIVVQRRVSKWPHVILIAGRHRLEAFKRLKRKTIPAMVETEDSPEVDRKSKIIEVDENLVRHVLCDTDRQKLLARQKQLYEAKHPETKQGGDRKSAKAKSNGQNGRLVGNTFSKKVAKATGRSERAVRRDIQRAEALGEKNLDAIKGTSLEKGKEQDALIKMPVEERDALIARAAAGENVSAVEVLAQRKPPEPAPETEHEAVEPDSSVVVLSALPKPEALQNGNADPSQQRTPPLDAPSPYLDALATLRRIKGIYVSVVETVPPAERMVFSAAVHEAALRIDELKDALLPSGAA